MNFLRDKSSYILGLYIIEKEHSLAHHKGFLIIEVSNLVNFKKYNIEEGSLIGSKQYFFGGYLFGYEFES
jgi:hypothetical protein